MPISARHRFSTTLDFPVPCPPIRQVSQGLSSKRKGAARRPAEAANQPLAPPQPDLFLAVVFGQLPHERTHLVPPGVGAQVHHPATNLRIFLDDHATKTPERGLEDRQLGGASRDVLCSRRHEPVYGRSQLRHAENLPEQGQRALRSDRLRRRIGFLGVSAQGLDVEAPEMNHSANER